MINTINPINSNYCNTKNKIGFGISVQRLNEIMLKNSIEISVRKPAADRFLGKLQRLGEDVLMDNNFSVNASSKTLDGLFKQIAKNIPEGTELFQYMRLSDSVECQKQRRLIVKA